MIIALSIALFTVSIFLTAAIIHIRAIQRELQELSEEQHSQNKDIITLMKTHMTHQEMLMQHIEILKYLVDQDPMIGRKVRYTGPVGEA